MHYKNLTKLTTLMRVDANVTITSNTVYFAYNKIEIAVNLYLKRTLTSVYSASNIYKISTNLQ